LYAKKDNDHLNYIKNYEKNDNLTKGSTENDIEKKNKNLTNYNPSNENDNFTHIPNYSNFKTIFHETPNNSSTISPFDNPLTNTKST
jgi:hypothetical protein